MARPLDAFRRCLQLPSSPCIWRNHPSPPPPPPHLHSHTHLISTSSFLSHKEHAFEDDSTTFVISSSRTCSRRWWHGISLRFNAWPRNVKPHVTARSHNTIILGCMRMGCLQTWERLDAEIDHPIHKVKVRAAAPAAGSRWKLLLRKLRARILKWMQSSCIANAQECSLHEFRYDPVSYALNFDDGRYTVPHLIPCSPKPPATLSLLG